VNVEKLEIFTGKLVGKLLLVVAKLTRKVRK